MIKVRPANEALRQVLRHPIGLGFDRADGTGLWPADQFTFRRLREGAVVPVAEAAPPAPSPKPDAVPDTAYLRTAEPRAAQGAISIPDNWRDLAWQERRSIAAAVSDHPIINGDDANAAIEAELAHRATGE